MDLPLDIRILNVVRNRVVNRVVLQRFVSLNLGVLSRVLSFLLLPADDVRRDWLNRIERIGIHPEVELPSAVVRGVKPLHDPSLVAVEGLRLEHGEI